MGAPLLSASCPSAAEPTALSKSDLHPRVLLRSWLHGSLSMIQDRLKIDKLRAGAVGPDVMLGRQSLLNCAAFQGYGTGCDGGDVIDVLRYMKASQLPDETCQPYSGGGGWLAQHPRLSQHTLSFVQQAVLYGTHELRAAACRRHVSERLLPAPAGHSPTRCLSSHHPPCVTLRLPAASDHTKYGKHAKKCPAEGYCINCMPIDGKDTCWAVKSPIRYGLGGYGQITVRW